MNPSELALVVVTYNPPTGTIGKLQSYAEFLGHIVVVDNTENAVATLVDDEPANMTRLPLGTNLGIAHALNVGVDHAEKLGFGFVLLLDQDSRLTRNAVASACSEARDDIGIVSLRQVVRGPKRNSGDALFQGCVDRRVAMTSGSILNLQAYRQCGKFESKLFIDYVDHDYCLRLRRIGFRVVECQHAALEHELGDPMTATVFGVTRTFLSHHPFRSYYIVRNGLYVVTNYLSYDPATAIGVVTVLFKELIKAVSVESDKLRRLGFMGLGAWHWLSNRYGKLETR